MKRVLAIYEEARQWALANPAELKGDPGERDQAARPGRSHASSSGPITPIKPLPMQRAETILAAGLALQKAGVIKPDVDVKAATAALIDTQYAAS